MGEYYVMWKFPKRGMQRATYDAPSLDKLLHMLDRTEDVSFRSTEQLFVHYHATDGSVLEVVSHDAETGLRSINYAPVPKAPPSPPPKSTVVPINPVNKPRIKVKTLAAVVAANGLYQAYQA